MPTLFVSVNNSFHPGMSLAELQDCMAGNYDVSVPKAGACDVVVAMWNNGDAGPAEPVGACRLRGAYTSTEAPEPGHYRTALDLGDALPVLPAYRNPPVLRRGVAVVTELTP